MLPGLKVLKRSPRLFGQVIAFFGACLLLASVPAAAEPQQEAAAPFKVLAFYSGTYDAAHIDFEKEANIWFPQQAAANGYTYTATTNWNQLTTLDPSQAQVVLFLDDQPQSTAQYQGFQRYMEAGGAFFGFHVTAYNDAGTTAAANWFHNDFLGTGRFATNTWGPTAETLKIENHTSPATANLPSTIQSSVSEWYSWEKDLRQNSNIQILASLDPSTFPVGSDPNQQWRSGYYPIMWANKNFKMLYANFGHNAMNYQTNTRLSSTFESADQNKFVLDGLKGLGGGGTTTPPDPGTISPTAWYAVVNKAGGKCVDARGAASANGTVIQQYTCNGSAAQQFQFQPTSGGFTRVNNNLNAAKVIDVTGVSTAVNAPVQLWSYAGGANQQWQPVSEGGGYYHFVNKNSSKCLAVPGGSTADSVQLVQAACTGGTGQSFHVA
ncbi:RICIN domain-containing protein [Amycolatopsis sp. H20-H5]|uniref:RICIN domain-containing protein n=1 Tax=Amycolatopsis sp. H20-H5 TaxID=3046309 RepID=UPI002DBB0A9D|nr:RICIN domain-containing protein [Amycolatopsis sp. H20-H5]MEC3978487.1 RICIN domain-containing protein [Amycolatopsis sp. H20-H5]